MKRILIFFAIASILFTSSSLYKRAEAGVTLTAISFAISYEMPALGFAGIGIIPGGLTAWGSRSIAAGIVVGAPFSLAHYGALIAGPILIAMGNIPTGVLLLMLDEKSPASHNDFEALILDKYPFITDREVSSVLATEMKNEIEKTKLSKNEIKLVSINEEKIRAILEPLDISEEEVRLIVNDFK